MLVKEVFTFLIYLSVINNFAYADWVEISQNYFRKDYTPDSTYLANKLTGVHKGTITKYRPNLAHGVDRLDFGVDDFGDSEYFTNVTTPKWPRRNKHTIIADFAKVTTVVPKIVTIQRKVEKITNKPENTTHVNNRNNFQKETHPKQSIEATKNENISAEKGSQINNVNDSKIFTIIKHDENIKSEDKDLKSSSLITEYKPNDFVNVERGMNMNDSKVEEIVLTEKSKEEEVDNEGNEINPKEKEPFGTLTGIIRVLKLVQNTISKNSHRTLKSKTRYLRELRDTIMCNIEERIDKLWPSEEGNRSAAGRSSKGDGHIDFPSAESALMSISFLTFAVFLIKLIMQVIHTYKQKAMMLTPVFTAMSRAGGSRTTAGTGVDVE